MRNISLWQYAGFAFTSMFGTLLHFVYDWTNKSVFVAPFSAINESTWEHMKLLFFSLLVFSIVQSMFFKDYPNFWCIKLIGILTGLLLIPTIFYTANGVFGKTPDWINIAIFFISVAAVYILETYLFKNKLLSCNYSSLAILAIVAITFMFVLFTFLPPDLPIFKAP